MILDIRYVLEAPEQIQGVRLVTVYPFTVGDALPELVIHFKDYKPQRNILQSKIVSVTISND